MEFLLEGIMAITWKQVVMYVIGGLLIYLAIKKDFEPALLMPMGFGAILVNLPVLRMPRHPQLPGQFQGKRGALLVKGQNPDTGDSRQTSKRQQTSRCPHNRNPAQEKRPHTRNHNQV